ncbi:MAG: Family ership [Pseudomonadota bacterium]
MIKTSEEKASLLIIDDDKSIRYILQKSLEDEGYQVEIDQNGQEALSVLAAGYRPVMILLDIHMPIMDGLQFLAAKARESSSAEIGVIVISAADGVENLFLNQRCGFLRKPINFEELMPVLKMQFYKKVV